MPQTSKRRTSGTGTRRPMTHSSDLSSNGLLTATIQELGAFTTIAPALRRHFNSRSSISYLRRKNNVLDRRLFNAIHGESSATSSSISPTQTTVAYNSTPSSTSQVTSLRTSDVQYTGFIIDIVIIKIIVSNFNIKFQWPVRIGHIYYNNCLDNRYFRSYVSLTMCKHARVLV